MKVGVNSRMVREISSGPLSISYLDVELVELGFNNVALLDRNLEIKRFIDPENVKESIKAVKGDPRLLEVYNQHEYEIINLR